MKNVNRWTLATNADLQRATHGKKNRSLKEATLALQH